eukprot:3411676-Pyramimonas_sp.AAC.1
MPPCHPLRYLASSTKKPNATARSTNKNKISCTSSIVVFAMLLEWRYHTGSDKDQYYHQCWMKFGPAKALYSDGGGP